MRTRYLVLSLMLVGAAAGAQTMPAVAGFTSSIVRAPVLRESATPLAVDAADSLYRQARAALNDNDFKKAATLFANVADRFPDSEFAPDALYYRAYALYRSGSSRELDQAVIALDRQATRYPKAATGNDAKQLRASIRSEQAKRGDGSAGLEIATGGTTLKNESHCPTDDDDMRLTALSGIMQLDPDQVLPVLQKLLTRRDECSVGLRRRAVYMVAQTKEEERADILLRVASTDPSTEVRREAVQWLSSVNTERAAKALDSILFNAVDADTRDRALSALAQHKNPAARQSLHRFAESSTVPIDLRVRAVNYIAQNRRTGMDETEYLRSLFNKTASPELREAIIQGVANQKTADRWSWLLGIARDKNQEIEVRKKAIFYAGQTIRSDYQYTYVNAARGIGSSYSTGSASSSSSSSVSSSSNGKTSTAVEPATPELKELLAMYDEFNGQVEMQDQLLYVYANRREVEATDKLLDIAKNEKNPELRRKAVSWLGQRKNDPRVTKFLLDLLSQ